MNDLTSKDRNTLSKAAHDIRPVMQIGTKGLTEASQAKIEESLKAHELIKIKFMDYKGEKNEITATICKKCNAAIVRIIGNTAIIYRPAPKKEDRKYNITL